MAAYSMILDKALALSARAHRAQVRKGSEIPYIIHPVHAAMLLLKYQFPEEAVVAAVLHDVVEDTDVTLNTIAQEFGAVVARVVDQVSEKKVEEGGEGKKLPWRVRKQEQLDRLAQADTLTAAVKAADALHNCHSMLRDLHEQGNVLWQRFRGSAADQLWYYTALAAVVRQRLGAHPICAELDEAVAELAAWHRKTSSVG